MKRLVTIALALAGLVAIAAPARACPLVQAQAAGGCYSSGSALQFVPQAVPLQVTPAYAPPVVAVQAVPAYAVPAVALAVPLYAAPALAQPVPVHVRHAAVVAGRVRDVVRGRPVARVREVRRVRRR